MCACVWTRHPQFGDIIIEQCAKHAAETANGLAAEALRDSIRAQTTADRELDRELDRVVGRRR